MTFMAAANSSVWCISKKNSLYILKCDNPESTVLFKMLETYREYTDYYY